MLLPRGGSWEAMSKLVLTSTELSPHPSSRTHAGGLLFTEESLWGCENQQESESPGKLPKAQTAEPHP